MISILVRRFVQAAAKVIMYSSLFTSCPILIGFENHTPAGCVFLKPSLCLSKVRINKNNRDTLIL